MTAIEGTHLTDPEMQFADEPSDLIDADPVADRAERYLGREIEKTDPSHASILIAIITAIHRKGLAIDALGSFRDITTWNRVACDPVAFSEDISFQLRAEGMRVDSGRVGETFRTMARDDAGHRRRELVGQFLGKPGSLAGKAELRRWLRAVTGEERPGDMAALLHWVWLVKNRVAGRHGERHLMLVVYGAVQGSGKSVAVTKLCDPWRELFDSDLSIDAIVDERNAPHLADCAIGFWDELGGLIRADMEKLKHKLSAPTVAYRPMRSNQRVELPMLMTFIAATNRSIAELVKDPTGMRRFYEIRAADRIDWAEVNAIDYGLLWQSVNEDEAAPGITYREIIALAQAPLVWRDPVQRWLEDEDEAGWDTAIDDLGQPLGKATPTNGIPSSVLYARFRAWCLSVGEKELTRELMGRRLGDLGWELFRLPRSLGQAKAYRRRSVIDEPAALTVHTCAHLPF